MGEEHWIALPGYAGLSVGQPKEALSFAKEWENTRHSTQAMRAMWSRRFKASAKALGFVLSVEYWTNVFIRDIMDLEFGGTLDDTFDRSNRGLTIASLWGQITDTHTKVQRERNDLAEDRATNVTPADALAMQGTAKQSPTNKAELIEAIEATLTAGHASWGLEGDQMRKLVQLRDVLREKYAKATLEPSLCADIYWSAFKDGRSFVRQDGGVATSTLDAIVGSLQRDMIPRMINVPYALLQPPAKKPRPSPSPGGGGGGGKPATQRVAQGAVTYPAQSLVSRWKKAVAKEPGLKVMDLVMKGKLDGFQASFKRLNLVVGGKRCLVGVVTGACDNPQCNFVHNLPTPEDAVKKLGDIMDGAISAL